MTSVVPNPAAELPYLLDFYPLQGAEHTRIHPFFDNLRAGKLTTTRCRRCLALHWQPRAVCPDCSSEDLEWVELPSEGTVFAHTALLKGAPYGMERDMPLTIAVVELAAQPIGSAGPSGTAGSAKAPGRTLRILSRIEGATHEQLRIGQRVRLRIVNLPDGRVFYRFARA
ncbi:MAG TPA: OB-fold domain-containing protein [Candidatus Thermoplasmatota archaeon]|nr:OB-fold domain-containing protein [Candidatus Thermoplasmatota archaeon]